MERVDYCIASDAGTRLHFRQNNQEYHMNPKSLTIIIIGLAALAGLFVVMKPQPSAPAPDTMPSGSQGAAVAPATAALAAPVLTVVIEVRGGQRVAGPAIIEATQGQVLRLRVVSDRADELHLHGYDRSLKLSAGVPAELLLELKLSGRFEFELHHAHYALGVVEVQPSAAPR